MRARLSRGYSLIGCASVGESCLHESLKNHGSQKKTAIDRQRNVRPTSTIQASSKNNHTREPTISCSPVAVVKATRAASVVSCHGMWDMRCFLLQSRVKASEVESIVDKLDQGRDACLFILRLGFEFAVPFCQPEAKCVEHGAS